MARDRDRRPDNRFKEFEFGEEDERSEKETKLLLAKLKRKERRHSGSPVDHYKLLQCFASVPAQQRETRNTPIDIDEEEICNTKSRRKKTNDARTDRKGEVARVAKIHRSETNIRPIDLGSGGCLSTYPATCQMGTLEVKNIKQTSSLGSLSVPSKDEGQDVGLISDDDDDDLIEMSSSSTFASPLVEKKVLSQERLSVSGTNEPESAAEAGKVYIYPDFIIHGELYCTTALLTFSNAAFMVEGLTVNGTDETLSFRWAIEDIISIESEWCGRVETAFTSLLLRSKNSKTADNANPASEIESFRISVHDPYWSEKEVAIKSLSVKYMDKWKIIYNIDKENGEDDLWRQNYEVSSKPYFSDLDKSFEEFIYPEGDPDAVLIRRKDVELLRPQTFINDTIIDSRDEVTGEWRQTRGKAAGKASGKDAKKTAEDVAMEMAVMSVPDDDDTEDGNDQSNKGGKEFGGEGNDEEGPRFVGGEEFQDHQGWKQRTEPEGEEDAHPAPCEGFSGGADAAYDDVHMNDANGDVGGGDDGGTDKDVNVVAELQGLKEEVKGLRAEVSRGFASLKRENKEMAATIMDALRAIGGSGRTPIVDCPNRMSQGLELPD